ncbi:MAG: hypothetical protein ACRENP_02125 [Longimicrobiales bacterium]
MTIEVQCAAPRRAGLGANSIIRADGMTVIRAVEIAAQRSVASGNAVYLKF